MLLLQLRIAAAYFGIAAYRIQSMTLHSLLKLSFRGKKKSDLKGIHYQTYNFIVMALEICLLTSFLILLKECLVGLTEDFGKPQVKLMHIRRYYNCLVSDFAQLSPVSDEDLYNPFPCISTTLMGFSAYQLFRQIVRPEQNQTLTDSKEGRFRQLLVKLRDDNSALEDWKILLERNISFFKKIDRDTVK